MSPKTSIGWFGLAVLTVTLSNSLAQAQDTPQAAAPAAADTAAAPAAYNPAASVPYGKGDAKKGADKAAVCMACHGPNGNSANPEWPSLAGQSATYIAEQLHLFKLGGRKNDVMAPMAAALSDEDMADLSMYFAQQVPTGGEADPANYKLGQKLYFAGDVSRGIPACASCHGPVGRGNPPAGYPALRAQHSVYTVSQLTRYATDARYEPAPAPHGRNAAMMTTVAKRLSQDDIRNVASFLQGLR